MSGDTIANFWDEMYQNFDPTVPVLGELELPPGIPPIAGKTMLIVACGTGQHVVRACRGGADVVALDISPRAVANARAMVEHNGLSAQYVVTADGVDTTLLDAACDFIWGEAVLHHLDHEKSATEFARILKPGGTVCMMSEPTFYNPLLKLAYEFAFGEGRTNRRRKFLFFTRRGDDFEKPIVDADLLPWRTHFEIIKAPRPLMLFEKVGHVLSRARGVHRAFGAVDRLVERIVPGVRKYTYEYDFIFVKR